MAFENMASNKFEKYRLEPPEHLTFTGLTRTTTIRMFSIPAITIENIQIFGSNGTYLLVDLGSGKKIVRARTVFSEVTAKSAFDELVTYLY